MDIPPVNVIGRPKTEMLIRMIERNINSPLTCGAGRLFDAVASLLGLADVATFQAEGPMKLESIVQDGIGESYPFSSGPRIGLGVTIKSIVDDIENEVKKETIATKLHNTVIIIIFDTVRTIRSNEDINKVVLSGGVFQNKYLLEGSIRKLLGDGFEVYSQAAVPANDGGIALGQLAVASKRREMKCV
jgi:hydrogenase maturation protein HypF